MDYFLLGTTIASDSDIEIRNSSNTLLSNINLTEVDGDEYGVISPPPLNSSFPTSTSISSNGTTRAIANAQTLYTIDNDETYTSGDIGSLNSNLSITYSD